ncbi:serine hydrolase [Zobellia nedashkovskayae]
MGLKIWKKKTSINPQTSVFRIASVSKPISAAALAHMVAEGLIDLDASFLYICTLLPKKEIRLYYSSIGKPYCGNKRV